ncbi:MAG TPA: monofunctional biosynthetic peptidoglycan transglycosylase [Paludibacteraceae bacterium]|nr:monofunctional biosynthetic peptidoglycan transglycosylase [Paludibacteraceae bacterium]HPL93963.1 monofunctional biosynthetic peptidoglycan transglycosylase [Paludibacteraceae bacterium]
MKVVRILRNIVLGLFLSSILLVILYRFVPVYITPLMIIRVAEQVADGKPIRLERGWVPIDEISPKMVRAVIASEDNLFLDHYGFDIEGMKKAFENNKKGEKLKGGSTISQQTAKNVFLTPSRTYVRKALEAYFTVLIEIFWSKERIMEVYLNVIEMGNGIYGIEKASEIYFNKPPQKLTSFQAALVAASLPNPRKYSITHPGPYMRKRQAHILWLMPKLGKIEFE